ncbi:(2Fe-2S)-binding protein [Marinospirillum sp.]|uniref:(2Fe-2S)-binding protein n=1 Tax=Marinospirillum sp. TaxID=2183934 RepID=UPI003A8766D9
MYVCICHGITDSQIRQGAQQGMQHVRDLYQQMSLGSQCGKCVCTAKQVLSHCQSEAESSLYHSA